MSQMLGWPLAVTLTLLAPTLAVNAQPTRQPSIPALIQALRNRDATVRLEAARRLAELGPAARDAIPALVEALRDPIEAGVQIERDAADVWAHKAAADALARIGPDAVPALIHALGHSDPTVRLGAIRALGQIEPPGTDAVLALVHAVQDPEAGVRQSAIIALGQLRPPAKAAVPALTRALGDPDPGVRRAAVDALHRIEPGAASSAPVSPVPGAAASLVHQFRTATSIEARQRAADALVALGPAAKDAVPALIEILRDPRVFLLVRIDTAAVLGRIGPPAADAVPALIEVIGEGAFLLSTRSSQALSAIGQAAVPDLIQALRPSNDWVRMFVAQALGGIGPNASQAAPALRDVLSEYPAPGPPSRAEFTRQALEKALKQVTPAR